LNLLSWIEHITEIVVQFSWWRQSERVKVPLLSPRLNHATQCVPTSEVSSRFIIAHSFRFDFFGKVSLKKKHHKSFSNQFFHRIFDFKFAQRLFEKITFSTWMFICSKQNFPILLATSYQFPNPLLQT